MTMFVNPKINQNPYLSDQNIQTSVLSEKTFASAVIFSLPYIHVQFCLYIGET